MNKGKILVIDDAATVKRFMEINLKQIGYDVITAPNAKTGVHKAQKETPDLIVTDYVLPDANGGQICSYLRKNSKYDHIPIIMISGDKENFENKRIRSLPGIHFLCKPFTGQELAQKVDQILQKQKEKILEPIKSSEEKFDIEQIKDILFRNLESYTDEFIKAKYSFQVKQIIFKAMGKTFEKIKNNHNE